METRAPAEPVWRVRAELRSGDGARKLNREVTMIRHATSARTLAASIAGDRGEVGMERRTDASTEARETIPRAEDEVEQDVVERLWHGEGSSGGCHQATMNRAFGAEFVWVGDPGRCPRLL